MLKEITLKWLKGKIKEEIKTPLQTAKGLTRHRDLPTQNYPTRFPAQKQMTTSHDKTKTDITVISTTHGDCNM